jgi:hypothetical protein
MAQNTEIQTDSKHNFKNVVCHETILLGFANPLLHFRGCNPIWVIYLDQYQMPKSSETFCKIAKDLYTKQENPCAFLAQNTTQTYHEPIFRVCKSI